MADAPKEVRLAKDRRSLAVTFADGAAFTIAAELLRVRSTSAEVKGHGVGGAVTVGGKRTVTIRGVEPVGRYAVRLVFDDGHNTGLYTWAHLRELGETAEASFSAYLADLAAKGLDRDRPGQG